MSENIDIRVREDGSRVVSRSMDAIADKAEKAEKSVKGMNAALDDVQKKGTSLQWLRDNIQQVDRFSSSMVQRFGSNLSQYRSALMKHFEMISREAKATSASLKSQIESITATPIGIESMNAYYREQEAAQLKFLKAAANNIAQQQAMEEASSASRLKIATADIAARQAHEQGYTSWWAKELSTRDMQQQKAIAESVKSLKLQEQAEEQSNAKRLQYATQTINSKRAAEEAYTSWWIAELKKRDGAASASALKTAEQRSNMQAFNPQRMERNLIKGANPQSALYAAEDKGNLNQRTALQTAEMQAMQRQMAMMQLFLPMIEKENALQVEADNVVKRQIANKEQLARGNHNLSTATRKAGDDQKFWNDQSREAHSLARGLSGALGTLWLTYGSLLPLLTGAALGSAFVQAAKSGSEMAYQLQFVKSLGGESADAIEKLKNQSYELGTKGQFGPKEIASSYRILAQAGLEAADSLKVMPDVLNLATVGELGMEQAGLAVVGTLNAFKLGVEESGRVSDLFAKAAAVSQSSVEDLTQAMKYASTVGTQYKQSVDETITALALLAKVNIVGTSAGTAYRNMLKEIYMPTKQAADEWKRLGVETTKVVNGQRQVRSFVDIMYDLKKVTDKYDEPSQGKIIGYLFGERGAKEAAEMLSMTAEQWKAFQDKIVNSAGFGQKVADELNNTANGQWKIALNTLEAELTQSFNRMEPQFKQLAQSFKTIFESEDFRSAVDTIVKTTLTLMQTFLDLAPIIYQVVKAWLVLKAAQIGAGLASMFAAGATAAQGLAAGMLAASGAMGPVARGVTMLTPLIGALGGPLAVILGLLTAGAAAWALWGLNAETASGKAIESTEERLRQLKSEQKFGDGELGKAREELETRENRLSHMVAARQSGNNLDEARKAVEVQQQLVTLLEEREQKMKAIAKVTVPKVEVPKSGTQVWNTPEKDKSGTGPSGRLNKDDQALATLQAKLLASEKEYAMITMTGQAQLQLNDGQKESLKIRQQIDELEAKSTTGLQEKGLKQRAEQLASLKEQLAVSEKLGVQLQQNEMLKVNTKLEEETRLTKLLPQQREVENKFLQIRNELLQNGVILDGDDEATLRRKIDAQIELNKVIQARDEALNNSLSTKLKEFEYTSKGIAEASKQPGFTNQDKNSALYNANSDMFQGTQIAIDAQLKAYQDYFAKIKQLIADKNITEEQGNQLTIQNATKMQQELVSLSVQAANTRLQLGTGSWADSQLASLATITKGFTTFEAGATQIMGNFFQNFTDGFANSVGRAIVYSDNLGEALHNVAREAIASLISALVKLGIQYVVNAALGNSIATTSIAKQTALGVASASTLATAWSPVAALVSLASFGSNSVPAMAGITATAALSKGLALTSVAKFEQGGYTGNISTKEIAGVVHGREFVFDAASTQRIGVSNLEAIRNGATYASSSGGVGVNVKIENYGTSKDFEVQQISESDIRIIARDEARSMVQKEAPGVVAAQIRNPNSSVSKSLGQNTQTQRRR